MSPISSSKLVLSPASEEDKQAIYSIRHAIYAIELKQHKELANAMITDSLDEENRYIVSKYNNEVVGFISITTPASKRYSVDKYFSRALIPYAFNDLLYEVRLLTVIKEKRNNLIALALMYAALRWVQSHGGKYIVAICRDDLMNMYEKAGLHKLGYHAQSGKLIFELCVSEIEDIDLRLKNNNRLLKYLESRIDWKLPFLFLKPAACYHGGSFFKAIGEDLQHLEMAKQIINADVLDAWFPPSLKVLKTIQENLSYLLQTSPPTNAEGLIKVISQIRGINEQAVLPGAGSSDLIFLALTRFLNKRSKVLILDPCYGEYFHVLEKVVQCQVTRYNLLREEGFVLDIHPFLKEVKKGYDMVIMVNPNSPTGVYTPKMQMEAMMSQIPLSTIVWIDETYIEYTGMANSLEKLASTAENIIVCKSMSKVYALSGVRAAYLCGAPHLLEALKPYTPPWSLSLPAQAAAIAALKDTPYYVNRYLETHALRNNLKSDLQKLGITDIVDGVANFILFYLPDHFPPIDEFLESCKGKNLFLRNVSNMGNNIGNNAVRIAVKDNETNNKMVAIISNVRSLR